MMLTFYQNIVSLVGWISEITPPTLNGGFCFRIVHGDHHQHFHDAILDAKHSIVMEIRISRYEDEVERCHEHLKVGDRVTIRGKLVTDNQLINGRIASKSVWINAMDIERCETIESFRYVNHPWRASFETETKPIKSKRRVYVS